MSCREFVGALYDWQNTSVAGGLWVSVWVNNSNVARQSGPPEVQRWNLPLNLAANAFLKHAKVGHGCLGRVTCRVTGGSRSSGCRVRLGTPGCGKGCLGRVSV